MKAPFSLKQPLLRQRFRREHVKAYYPLLKEDSEACSPSNQTYSS